MSAHSVKIDSFQDAGQPVQYVQHVLPVVIAGDVHTYFADEPVDPVLTPFFKHLRCQHSSFAAHDNSAAT